LASVDHAMGKLMENHQVKLTPPAVH